MKIDLESLDIADLVQSACVKTLTSTLAQQLPKVVGDMLQVNGRNIGNDNILRKTFDAAIKEEVIKCVNAFILEHEDEIHAAVAQALRSLIAPEAIAAAVVRHLSEIKLPPVKIFGKMSVPDEEDED